MKCKCTSISQSILGDGCDICNPEMAEEIRLSNLIELENEYESQREEIIGCMDQPASSS